MKSATFQIGSVILLSVVLAALASMRPTTSVVQPPTNVSRLTAPSPGARARASEGYGRLPLSFEANRGQTDGRVKFLSRGAGYTLFLTGDEAVLSLASASEKSLGKGQKAKLDITQPPPPDDAAFSGLLEPPALFKLQSSIANRQSSIESLAPGTQRLAPDAIRLQLVGANPAAKVAGLDELPGKSNYFIGNDPKKWRTNVANYAKVRYAGVYPGVDLVYYGNQRQLEYDFVVAPGADPKTIRFELVGEGSALPRAAGGHPYQIDPNGDLVIATDGGEVRFHKPVVYQQDSHGRKQYIDGHYALRASESRIQNPKFENLL